MLKSDVFWSKNVIFLAFLASFQISFSKLHNPNHNYCRNPDGDPLGPWCYIISKSKSFDYCRQIPLCDRVVNRGQLPVMSHDESSQLTTTPKPSVPPAGSTRQPTRPSDDPPRSTRPRSTRPRSTGECGRPFIKFRPSILTQITDLANRRWHPGTLKRSVRVKGGKQAPVGALPWTASIRHGNETATTCAGTVIGPYFIVTAAHCIFNVTVEALRVKVGVSSYVGLERIGYTATIRAVRTHPDYQDGYTPRNDIGLIFTEKMPFDTFKRNICIGKSKSDLKVC